MTIKDAIRILMRAQGVTLADMGRNLTKKDGVTHLSASDVSSRLVKTSNMSFTTATEMLNVLGYEIIVQKRRRGCRRDDQIVIDQI